MSLLVLDDIVYITFFAIVLFFSHLQTQPRHLSYLFKVLTLSYYHFFQHNSCLNSWWSLYPLLGSHKHPAHSSLNFFSLKFLSYSCLHINLSQWSIEYTPRSCHYQIYNPSMHSIQLSSFWPQHPFL